MVPGGLRDLGHAVDEGDRRRETAEREPLAQRALVEAPTGSLASISVRIASSVSMPIRSSLSGRLGGGVGRAVGAELRVGEGHDPAPAMQARPPLTTLNVGVVHAATMPASKSPSRGPPVTTRMKIVDSRPRRRSGVASWAIVERKIALITSAAPQGEAHERERQVVPDQAEGGDRGPPRRHGPDHATPRRWTRRTHPADTAPSKAPTEGAANSRPTISGPRSNWVNASTGNSAAGMPKIMATRSITNVDATRRFGFTKREPLLDRGPSEAPSASCSGGIGRIIAAATSSPA